MYNMHTINLQQVCTNACALIRISGPILESTSHASSTRAYAYVCTYIYVYTLSRDQGRNFLTEGIIVFQVGEDAHARTHSVEIDSTHIT